MFTKDAKCRLIRVDMPNLVFFIDLFGGNIHIISEDKIYSNTKRIDPNTSREVYKLELEKRFLSLVKNVHIPFGLSFNEMIVLLKYSNDIAEFFTSCYYDQNLLSLKLD